MRTRRVRLAGLTLAFALVAAPASAASLSQSTGADGCIGAAKGCTAGNGANALEKAVVSPDGKNLYAVANDGEWGALLSFARDPATGALTQLPGEIGCTSFSGRGESDYSSPMTCAIDTAVGRANDIAVSPDGLTVYTLSSEYFVEAIGVWRRDVATGALTRIQCVSGAPTETCVSGAFVEPHEFVLSADGKFLTIGGGSLSTLPVHADGTLGAGQCYFRFARGSSGSRPLCAAAPFYARKMTVSGLEGSGSKLFAGVDAFNSPAGNGKGLAQFAFDATTGAVSKKRCAGSSPAAGVKCPAIRAFGYPFDLAISPDGSGVYTAGNDFVETDEEEGTGYIRASAVSAFTGKLAQLPGRKGCVLFTGRKNPGCATRPSSQGHGFSEATTIAVAPSGAVALGGFKTAVVLLKRNSKTQQLTPVAGTGGCVDIRSTSVSHCAAGRGLGRATSFTFSPDGLSVYATTANGIASLRLAG